MQFIKRLSLLLFGFFSGLVGFLSLLCSILLLLASHFIDNDGIQMNVILKTIQTIISEVLLAFGIAASLLSWRCILGPKAWIMKLIDYFWNRAQKIMLIMGFVAIAFGLIYGLCSFIVDYFTQAL